MLKTLKKNIFRSPYQSLAAVLIVSLAFFIITIFFLIGIGSSEVLKHFESRPQVVAYLKDEAKPQELELLKAKIGSNADVSNVRYVSKEEALKIYRDLFKDKPVLLEMVTAKYLPASFEVSTERIGYLKGLADFLKKEPIVEDVDFQEDVTLTLSHWLNSVRKFGAAAILFLFFVSLLTVIAVLGMKISQRKEEIDILKLIGASSWNIKLPLYCEGVLYGFFSAFISWGLSYVLILYSSSFLTKFLEGVIFFPVPFLFMLKILGGMMVLGGMVGFLGNFFAIWRFMKASR